MAKRTKKQQPTKASGKKQVREKKVTSSCPPGTLVKSGKGEEPKPMVEAAVETPELLDIAPTEVAKLEAEELASAQAQAESEAGTLVEQAPPPTNEPLGFDAKPDHEPRPFTLKGETPKLELFDAKKLIDEILKKCGA